MVHLSLLFGGICRTWQFPSNPVAPNNHMLNACDNKRGKRALLCLCVFVCLPYTVLGVCVTVAHTVCMSIVYAVHCYGDGLWVCVPLPYDGMVCGCVGLCRTLCWE